MIDLQAPHWIVIICFLTLAALAMWPGEDKAE